MVSIVVDAARAAPTRCSSCPTRSSSSAAAAARARGARPVSASAHERRTRPARTGRHAARGLGPPIKGPSALGADPRRLWHLTWTLARTEFKLALLRLGARLPVAADAPAAAVRRHLPGVQQVEARRRQPRALLPRRAAAGDRAVQLLQRIDRRRGALAWSTARTSCARSSSRGWRCRCRSCSRRCFNLCAQPHPRARLPARRGRLAALELARAAVADRACSRCSPPASAMLLSVALRALPRHHARSGKSCCR